MTSAILSLALPACQFPEYGMANGGGGGAGGAGAGGEAPAAGGVSGSPVDDAGTAGEAGSEAGAGGGGAGAPPLPPCDLDACVARPSWQGPVAYWANKASAALPDCPLGYGAPIDLHRELDVPSNTCACTCSPAEGQSCDTTLHIFTDKSCADECSSVPLQGQACTAVPVGCTGSQGSLKAANPTPSGGSCRAMVTQPATPTWKYNARLCPTSNAGTCEGNNQVCAPMPLSPYISQLCVMRVILPGHPLPACPPEYPNGLDPLYETFANDRMCSDCVCGGVSGGTCSGKLVVSAGSTCVGTTEYPFGGSSACKTFDLGPGAGVQPTSVAGQYSVVPGACSVTTPAKGSGTAVENGSVTVVCCQ